MTVRNKDVEKALVTEEIPSWAAVNIPFWDEEELLEEEEEQEEDEEEEEEDRGDEVEEEGDEDEDEEETEEEPEDDEDDDEEEEKEEEAENDEDKDKDDRKSQSIPRQRFDEVYGKFKSEREKNRQLAARVAELEKGGKGEETKTQPDDLSKEIKDLRGKMLKAIDDGKTDEASELMDKIDELNDRRIDQRLSEGFKTTSKASTQEVEYNLLVERIEEDLPVFDEASEHYDQDLVDDVMEIEAEFEKAGNAPAVALEKAMRYYKDEVEEAMKAKGLIDPDEKVETKKTLKSRSVDQKKKNKKAKGSQPSKTSGASKTDTLSVQDLATMSEEEFDKLSEAKIRELRGDLA